MKFKLITLLFLLVLISCKTAKVETDTVTQKSEQTESEFPKQIGFVNDFEEIFNDEQKKFLENLLDEYKETANTEIAVVTINSIPENMTFDQYAVKLSDNWKIGLENDKNGLTIVFSQHLKTVRISTTDKTRNLYLSNEFCQKVIDENMIPEFKKGNYYDGIILGLNELMEKLN